MLPGWNYALWFVVVRYSSRLNYFSTACVIRSVEVRHARGQQSTASVIGPASYPDYGRSSLPGAQLASGLRAVGHFAGLLEIGRASCRETVKLSVVGEALR